MKYTGSRTELASAAKWVARAIPKNPPTPVLAGMVVSVGSEDVTLSAFDYELALAATVDGTVGEPGKVVVPGWAFASFLGAARGDDVALSLDGGKFVVTCGASSSTFRTLELRDYPNLPDVGAKKTKLGSLSGDVLADIVARLLPLTSREPSEQKFQESVLIESDGHKVSVTVGTRYALGKESFDAEVKPCAMVAPSFRLNDALADFQGAVDLHQDGGTLTLASPTRTASLRLFHTAWPNVEPMLETKGKSTIEVDRETLAASLKLVGTASDRVQIEATMDELIIKSYTPEKGESKSDIVDVIDATSDGVGLIIAAQKYLQPIVNACTGQVVTISYHSGTIKPATVTDGRARFVFVPIKPKG